MSRIDVQYRIEQDGHASPPFHEDSVGDAIGRAMTESQNGYWELHLLAIDQTNGRTLSKSLVTSGVKNDPTTE